MMDLMSLRYNLLVTREFVEKMGRKDISLLCINRILFDFSLAKQDHVVNSSLEGER
jgi:hypothetical protein